MKRLLSMILSSLILLTALSLTSCRAPTPQLKDSFEADVSLSGEAQTAAHLTRTPDALTLTVTSPATAAGLTYTYSGEELTVSYAGHKCITDAHALPDGGLPQVLYEVLNSLDRANWLSSDDSGDVFTLSTAAGEACITLSQGIPTQISAEGMPYSITLRETIIE